MPHLRRVEHARRDRRPRRARARRRRGPRRGSRGRRPRRAPTTRTPSSAVRSGSASWTGSWAAASSPGRSCWWAASPGSASPPCSSRSRPGSPRRRPGAVRHRRGVHEPGAAACRATRARRGTHRRGRRRSSPRPSVGRITELVRAARPGLLVMDSVQTVASEELDGPPGSVGQVRESTLRLMELAKAEGVPVVLVGHVTKDGTLAGPKTLEHLVDVVLSIEGDRTGGLRLLRAAKNRYGSTEEVGVFEMGERGLVEVADPARAFLAEHDRPAPGSVGRAHPRGLAAAPGRGPGAGRAVAAPAPRRTASRRRPQPARPAGRRPRAARGGRPRAATTSTPTSRAGCPSRSPGSTCRSPWRWRRRCATARWSRGRSRSARWGCSASCAPSAGWTGGCARRPGSGSGAPSSRGHAAAEPGGVPGIEVVEVGSLADAVRLALLDTPVAAGRDG